MNLIPIGKNVILEPQKKEEKTSLGIILPDKPDEKPEIGIVIAVGPEANKAIEVGAKVMFKKYAPDEVELGGTKYLICEDVDILVVMTDEK